MDPDERFITVRLVQTFDYLDLSAEALNPREGPRPFDSHFANPVTPWTIHPYEVRLEFSLERQPAVRISEARISNRLDRGVLYLEPLRHHILAPHALFIDELDLPTEAVTRELFLVSSEVLSVTNVINNATAAEDMDGVHQPAITVDTLTSDIISPCALV